MAFRDDSQDDIFHHVEPCRCFESSLQSGFCMSPIRLTAHGILFLCRCLLPRYQLVRQLHDDLGTAVEWSL